MAINIKELEPPKDLSHHLSRVTRRRLPSKIKDFYKYFTIPGIGNLAGGLPNPGYFPYDTLEASAALPNRFKPTPTIPLDPPTAGKRSSNESPSAARVIVPHNSSEHDPLRKIDLETALQYGRAQGYPALHTFLKEFALTMMHPSIPYKGGADIILTCGSTDGFKKVLDAFNNAWDEDRDWLRERESMLVEEFAYMAPVQEAKPRGLNVVPVAIDDQGMMAEGPGGLADVLAKWDKSKGRIPHLMYTVTMGQNPTSGLLSITRRKQIYALCQQYDILIVEDDPYWYLQYPSALELSIQNRNHDIKKSWTNEKIEGRKSSGSAFLDSLVPSYLSIDVDGRVLRLDTFSKTIAPGCRLGWITAQPNFIERIERITETSTQQPSGFVQSLVAELLMGPDHTPKTTSAGGEKAATGWQMDGWIRWLEGLRGNYERRMQIMSTTLEEGKYNVKQKTRRQSITSNTSEDFEVIEKTQIYDFAYPMAGMFLWLRCHFENHPLVDKVAHPRLSQALWVMLTTDNYKVLVAPGTIFSPTEQLARDKGWQYFRLCFAAIDEDLLKKSSENFVAGMRDFFDIDDVKKIDELLEDLESGAVDVRLERLAVESENGSGGGGGDGSSTMWAMNPIVC